MYVNFTLRKEATTMEYKSPEVSVLANAIDAVQSVANKAGRPPHDTPTEFDTIGAYEDWE